MLTKVITATPEGVSGKKVVVEVDVRRGIPHFGVVGLADTKIKEASCRVKSALLNSNLDYPVNRITVNLVPAGIHKEGTHFDLPIAFALMLQQRGLEEIKDTAFIGEVSLDGKINRVNGVLPLVMCLRKEGIKNVVLPLDNAEEAAVIKDIKIIPASRLSQVDKHFFGDDIIPIYKCKKTEKKKKPSIDYAEVIGQESVKRAIVISVAGKHGMMMIGGPGCGKSMVAKRIPTVMPELSYDEKLEITGIYSVAGLLNAEVPIITERPFRNPHHTITATGLIGGGVRPKPGEITLAHRGVLFLDELGEFKLSALDAMRQPMEEGEIILRRNFADVTFPAQTMLVAAANPCKCGNLWNDKKMCTCTPGQLSDYRKKLTGPFSDRIDMHVKMYPVDKKAIMQNSPDLVSMDSEEMKKLIAVALNVQRTRYGEDNLKANGTLSDKEIKKYCIMTEKAEQTLMMAYEKMALSMRAYKKIIKVSRTIADLEESEIIKNDHVLEALTYRIDDSSEVI